MAFGAGVLISAVAYELVFEAITLAKLSGAPALGLFAGALTFFFCDRVISNMGASVLGKKVPCVSTAAENDCPPLTDL